MRLRWREHGLRAVFALGVGWALWVTLLVQLSYRWSDDGTAPYYALLDFLTIPAGIVLGLGAAWLLSAIWPRFLVVPENVALSFVLIRLLVYAPLAFVALGLGFGLAEWVHVVRVEDRSNPQYGLSILWAVLWYPAILTPAVAAVATWRAALPRKRATGGDPPR
jgi:hypothetical protein